MADRYALSGAGPSLFSSPVPLKPQRQTAAIIRIAAAFIACGTSRIPSAVPARTASADKRSGRFKSSSPSLFLTDLPLRFFPHLKTARDGTRAV